MLVTAKAWNTISLLERVRFKSAHGTVEYSRTSPFAIYEILPIVRAFHPYIHARERTLHHKDVSMLNNCQQYLQYYLRRDTIVNNCRLILPPRPQLRSLQSARVFRTVVAALLRTRPSQPNSVGTANNSHRPLLWRRSLSCPWSCYHMYLSEQ